jgi:hypothetical protein
MTNSNALIGNKDNNNSGYCLSKSGKVYVVYLRQFADVKLDLTGASGTYTVQWFNPRAGGKLVGGSVSQVKGGSAVSIGKPPADPDQDWVAVIRL